jgi:hypothetical protein
MGNVSHLPDCLRLGTREKVSTIKLEQYVNVVIPFLIKSVLCHVYET